MMKEYLGLVTGAAFALSGTFAAHAASLNPSDYGFSGAGTVLMDEVLGDVDVSGDLDTVDAADFAGDFFFEATYSQITDDGFFLFDDGITFASGDATIDETYQSTMAETIEVFFKQSSTLGYLLSIDISEGNVFNNTAFNFLDTDSFVDPNDTDFTLLADAEITLTEYENMSAIPLPAAGWLLIASFGCLAAIHRRKTQNG